ncbi:glycosyltransferase family 2 protein [Lactococcus termiticola]|uniref:Glycosyl transferase n=1 Tax=Lactococcus termiticola TaxID=2169526 RepID=A0A2R5HES1_9LACT|nr:glycosyltransferase family 2 protein [Lactococcus termiticola]GBG96549.1 glycosyl transferase [Lactococcus termiticola]
MTSKILLIIPAYNEAEGILETINSVETYRLESPYAFDYVVINDGSTDNEEAVLREHNINHVELIQNLGIGGAVQAGYIYAADHDYDIAIQFDGDGQHDIESLPKLVEPILKGEADFVVGSRFVENSTSEFKSTGARQAGITILSWLIKLTSKVTIKDVTSGYRAGNRKVIEQFINRYPSQYPEPESYMHLFSRNFVVKEVGVKMFERETGQSSINFWKGISYMISVSLSILATSVLKGGE